jgi:hypothetical protein
MMKPLGRGTSPFSLFLALVVGAAVLVGLYVLLF